MSEYGMGISDEYAWLNFALSMTILIAFMIHLNRSVAAYRHYHDPRAATVLVKAVGLVVVSLGVVISSLGLITADAVFAIAGLSIARGALLIVALTLVLADLRGRND